MLMEADATAAKKYNSKKDKPAPTAALVSAKHIAPAVVVMLSAILGNGSDSEYVDAPFFVSHFFLDCSIGGPTASTELPVCALIDNGSDSVLIDPIYADHLGLAHRRLPALKELWVMG
jgi:hypothetical protein